MESEKKRRVKYLNIIYLNFMLYYQTIDIKLFQNCIQLKLYSELKEIFLRIQES